MAKCLTKFIRYNQILHTKATVAGIQRNNLGILPLGGSKDIYRGMKAEVERTKQNRFAAAVTHLPMSKSHELKMEVEF